MWNDHSEGNGRGTDVALDTSDDKGIWDHPPRREAQGDGAAIVLGARESRVRGEWRQVSKKPMWRGTRDAKCRNHSGNHSCPRSTRLAAGRCLSTTVQPAALPPRLWAALPEQRSDDAGQYGRDGGGDVNGHNRD